MRMNEEKAVLKWTVINKETGETMGTGTIPKDEKWNDPNKVRDTLIYLYGDDVEVKVEKVGGDSSVANKKVNGALKNPEIKVGDILYSAWGYSMTIVTFYKVVERKGTSTLIIRELDQKPANDKTQMGYYGEVLPVEDKFIGGNQEARIGKSGSIKKLGGFKSEIISKWNGKPVFFDRMDESMFGKGDEIDWSKAHGDDKKKPSMLKKAWDKTGGKLLKGIDDLADDFGTGIGLYREEKKEDDKGTLNAMGGASAVDGAAGALGMYYEDADRPWSRVVWDRTNDEMVAHFKEECLKRIEDVLEYATAGHDKWNKAKLWKVIGKYCQIAANQCKANVEAVEFRKKKKVEKNPPEGDEFEVSDDGE